MNRRDLFKRLAAVPVAAAVAPLVIASDGVALNSIAHPTMEGDFDPRNLHYTQDELTDLGELSADSLETIEIELPAHEFNMSYFCVHCWASQQDVEDGKAPAACPFPGLYGWQYMP